MNDLEINRFQHSKRQITIVGILITGSYLVLTLLLSIAAPFSDSDLAPSLALVLHAIFASFVLSLYMHKGVILFLGAFFLRILLLFIDLYLREFVSIPHSGADTEFFYRLAIEASSHTPFSVETKSAGLFSRIIGAIFYFVGPVRIWAQYLNVIVGILLVLCIDYICIQLMIKEQNRRKAVLLAAFLPTSIIMSSILLREIMPTLFVALSLSAFINWYHKGNASFLIPSFIYIFIASMFHSGVIGLAIGYFFLVIFYNFREKKLRFSIKSITLFSLILAGTFGAFFFLGDAVLYKFRGVEEFEDLAIKGSAMGGSGYLTGLQINTPLQFILYAPIRAFYFIFSPLPMNWRGFNDIFTFLFDSIFYLFVCYLLIKRLKFNLQNKLTVGIVISIIATSIIFGVAVGNAGTAMRHRQKLSPFFIILLFGIKETQNEKRKTKKIVVR